MIFFLMKKLRVRNNNIFLPTLGGDLLKIEATPKEIADLINELKKPAEIINFDYARDARDGRQEDRRDSMTNQLTKN